MTDSEDPAMEAMESPDLDATVDRGVAQSKGEQLRPRHDPVLAVRECRDLRVWGEKWPHSGQ
jgi:hypothetical protein